MAAFSIIIPACNEAKRIERTLRDYAAAFADGELIVVLNDCTDGSAEAVARVAAPNVRVVEIKEPIGKGGAVRAGFLVAGAPLIGFADADGATPGAEMRRLFGSLDGVDAAIGSRWTRGARLDPPQTLTRRLASRAFNLLARMLTGLPFSDTQCGAKAFRADMLRDVMAHVETANFAFDVDLLSALLRRGARVIEVPIEWHDRSTSKIRLAHASVCMAAALVRLVLKRSILSFAVPLLDRLVPTQPLTMRELHTAFSNRADAESGPRMFEPEPGAALVEVP